MTKQRPSSKVSLSMEQLVPPIHHNYNNLAETHACMIVSRNQLLISKIKYCLSLDFILCLSNAYESFRKKFITPIALLCMNITFPSICHSILDICSFKYIKIILQTTTLYNNHQGWVMDPSKC